MSTKIASNETGKSVEVTGNATGTGFLVPNAREIMVVKGMLLHGDGNTGTTSIVTSSGRLLLKLYHSNQSAVSPQGRTNIRLSDGETIGYVVEGRNGGNKTFIGVSVEREKIIP